jgi:hypothetical protein
MTRVVDVWRAVDPEARLVSGDLAALGRAVRGVHRTRSAAPHLPAAADGSLLVIDAAIIGQRSLVELLAELAIAEMRAIGVIIAGPTADRFREPAGSPIPVLVSTRSVSWLADGAERYLDSPEEALGRAAAELRLAAAEAALADPDPAAPAGLVATRLRRGVAVAADGELRALHARPAGRALAARFAAAHARLLATSPGRSASRLTRDGLWVIERRIRPGASVWLFDDVPFARIDEVCAEALTVTLRALLRRTPMERTRSRTERVRPARPSARAEAQGVAGVNDRFAETLLAVALANGRVASAARALGVHRNTVLYRLRRAQSERGIDPRRPEDALLILREAERRQP